MNKNEESKQETLNQQGIESVAKEEKLDFAEMQNVEGGTGDPDDGEKDPDEDKGGNFGLGCSC